MDYNPLRASQASASCINYHCINLLVVLEYHMYEVLTLWGLD